MNLVKKLLERGWFRVDPEGYGRFDVREPVLNTSDMETMRICDEMHKIFLSPKICPKTSHEGLFHQA